MSDSEPTQEPTIKDGVSTLEHGQLIPESEVPRRIDAPSLLKSRWLPIFEKIPKGKALVFEPTSKVQLNTVRASLHNLQHRYGLLKGYRFVIRKDLEGKVKGYVIHGTLHLGMAIRHQRLRRQRTRQSSVVR